MNRAARPLEIGMDRFAHYLQDIVEPTIEDFEKNPTSVRHAFLACVATYHAIDYLTRPKSPETLRQQFQNESEHFSLVDSITHAFKHVTARGRNNSSFEATDVISRPPGVWGEFTWDLSRWDDPTGGVTLGSNRNVDLLGVVKRAAEFLREKAKTIQS